MSQEEVIQVEATGRTMSFAPEPRLIVGLGNGQEPAFPGKLMDFERDDTVKKIGVKHGDVIS
jgi:hypothetical protein